MKIIQRTLLSLILLLPLTAVAQTTIYTNDMDYVLGDVKQAFIQNKISTAEQINNLLIGFKAMKVNGIRIPIFPTGLEPNEAALMYFIQRATEEGFLIFANPAQGTGGKHLATGEFFSDKTVKDDPTMTQALIDRILQFDKDYACKWINPFNEDSRTNTIWSIDQINTIYSTIKDGLINAELIGSCAWGIPASIDIFEKTDIKNHITVSTTHNLGFNHSSWTQFINLSHASGLPVWDSEVNHNKKYADRATRLEAAIAYGVDGLVLYDSYKTINLATGAINTSAQTWMDLYIKPIATTTSNIEQANTIASIFQESKGFRIVFLSTDSYNVTVRDITGKEIRDYRKFSDNNLMINNLKHGMYVVVMKTKNQVQVEKIMVQ